MQQEYTPFGPEWAKEVKKLTKDQIINDFLRPALLKAKAEPGDEAAPPDNKDREIAFHKWVIENEYEINNRAQITHSIEQFHEIWEQSLTNKP